MHHTEISPQDKIRMLKMDKAFLHAKGQDLCSLLGWARSIMSFHGEVECAATLETRLEAYNKEISKVNV